jgi:hypothetical protein
MQSEDPVMHDTPATDTAVETQSTAVQAPVAAPREPAGRPEEWLEEPPESDLPSRPRRRLLGAGGNPIPLALIGVLLLTCGFIGGVLVEKGQNSSSSPARGATALASRFAALRGVTAAGSGGGFARGEAGGSAGSPSGGAGAGAGGAGATVGQVAYVSGHTLYVTSAEGNTVKVTTSAGSTVSKTVKSDVKSIHPGETAIVTGAAGANGAVSAETIRVSEAGASGGLGTLFAGGGLRGGSGRPGGGASSSSSGGASGAGGEPALFGK